MEGMLVVETVAKIRRLHLAEGRSIKAICRELGLSRKVVRKVLRSGATELRYERTRQPLPKLNAFWSGLGAEPHGTTPQQFGAFFRSELTKWAKVVKESGAKVE